jgi:hypothetical protein
MRQMAHAPNDTQAERGSKSTFSSDPKSSSVDFAYIDFGIVLLFGHVMDLGVRPFLQAP